MEKAHTQGHAHLCKAIVQLVNKAQSGHMICLSLLLQLLVLSGKYLLWGL